MRRDENSHEGCEGSPTRSLSSSRFVRLEPGLGFYVFPSREAECHLSRPPHPAPCHRLALPGWSVPGALGSRLETGECAEPWFRPFLVPFKLLLL